ncbi:zinc-binding dehydrogenase [Nocardia sp. CA2R105]|uniref:quinone oxidoreductase family protein n=1 Tax=Nocardia coffeae TaxID=2873381 RepID=UPI001CA63443|nr:zinc-binding dehydrogenase [Nocardia coffeae]MBY8859567.1 zinc-binding dehydrogenase [Nocardia coffeae]
MQAIVMTAVGEPEVLLAREVPDPHPGPGEILVRATAIPVLYPEIALRAGIFPMVAELPAVFGFQAAGSVAEIGPGVDATLLGARVVAVTAGSGAYAEMVCVPAESAIVIPAELPTEKAAAVLMGGSVATALLRRAALTGTETILVQAAATGVGGYLTQLAKEFGAKHVVATVGGDKTGRARALGADEVLDHRDPHWTRQLRDILAGNTIDVAFEAIGGSSAAELLDLMTPLHGRMLGYGSLSGEPAPITATDLLARGLTYTGCAGPAWLNLVATTRAEVLERAAQGGLEPLIDRTLPLDRAAHAHRLVQDRQTTGTIILQPNPTAP